MPTLRETAKVLGLSYKQAFRRFSAVRHLIPQHVRKGANGLLILDGGALEVLRRLEVFRKEGRSLREAAELIAEEISGNGSGRPREAEETPSAEALQVKVEMLERMVEELSRDRDHWRDLALNLQLALPAARPRHRWLAWLRFSSTTPRC